MAHQYEPLSLAKQGNNAIQLKLRRKPSQTFAWNARWLADAVNWHEHLSPHPSAQPSLSVAPAIKREHATARSCSPDQARRPDETAMTENLQRRQNREHVRSLQPRKLNFQRQNLDNAGDVPASLFQAQVKSLTASVSSESVARDQRERPQVTPRKRQRKSAITKVFEQGPPANMVGQLALDFMAVRDQEHSNTSDTTLRGYAKTLPRVWVVFKQQFDDWNGKNPLDILEVGNVRT